MRLRGLPALLILVSTGCSPRPPAPEPAPLPAAARREPAPDDGPLDLRRCVDRALLHAPAIRAARARADAAAAGMDLADTAWLPRIDLVWQEIRATRNNISGTMFPQAVIPGLSGPVGKTRSWDNGWGSNAGALLTYEPVDFGLRSANAEIAKLSARQSEADVRVSKLDAAATAAEAFLAHLATLQALRAASANLERWEVFAKSVHALADRDLRPGAEASRADAEVAAARNQVLFAEQTVLTGRLTLAESMGSTDPPGETESRPFLALPPDTAVPRDPSNHPLLERQSAAADSAQARLAALDHAYAPKLNLLVSANGRGSGFDSTGSLDADDGLFPTRPNWAAGLSLTFSAMDYFSIKARQQAEEGAARAERARADEVYLGLKMQGARLQAVIDTARKVAANTPVQLKAAQDAQSQARARYDAGLGTLTEVAEAQRLLAQAEIDDALARLGVWRALAASARVQGDLEPFLQLAGAARERNR